jgi:hypothetical protein
LVGLVKIKSAEVKNTIRFCNLKMVMS